MAAVRKATKLEIHFSKAILGTVSLFHHQTITPIYILFCLSLPVPILSFSFRFETCVMLHESHAILYIPTSITPPSLLTSSPLQTHVYIIAPLFVLFVRLPP